MIECELVRVLIDEGRDEQAIFLRESAGRRGFPILIGIFEATVIDRVLKERRSERPFTHDLLASTIRALGAKLAAVRIDRLEGEVFYATLAIEKDGGGVAEVDARPSDAIVLALEAGAKILVAEEVLAKAGREE